VVEPVAFLLDIQFGLTLDVPVVKVFKAAHEGGNQLLSGGLGLLRNQLLNLNIVVSEDLFVVGPGGQLCETNCGSFGQYAPLPDEFVVVGLYLIVFFSHAGHPEGPLVD
jgi:hypothetical protein